MILQYCSQCNKPMEKRPFADKMWWMCVDPECNPGDVLEMPVYPTELDTARIDYLKKKQAFLFRRRRHLLVMVWFWFVMTLLGLFALTYTDFDTLKMYWRRAHQVYFER